MILYVFYVSFHTYDQYPRQQRDGTPLVELRHVPLGWVFYYLGDILRISNRIMHKAHAPAVAPFRSSKIDCITTHLLSDEYTIVNEYCINRMALLNIVRGTVYLHGVHRARALATREDT